MREGWKIVCLGDISDIIAGQSPKGTAYNDCGNGLPFYQGKKQFTDKYIGEPAIWTTHVTKEAFPGDILMSVRAPVGPVNFAVGHICIGRGLAAIRAGYEVEESFLFYALIWKQSEIRGSEGAVFSSINRKQIEGLEVPLPSLDEQKRIVAILDEAFEGVYKVVSNTEKNLTNVREIFENYRNDIFENRVEGWQSAQLGELCTIKHGFAFKSEFFTTEGDYIVLTPGSFWEHGGFRDQGKKTKYYDGEVPEGYILEKEDFLFAMTEQAAGLLGSSLVVPESNRYLHNQRLGLIQVKEGVEWHNDFFFHQFNTPRFRAAVQATASGAKVRHTSPKKLCAIPVGYLPNREEQIRIADKLNSLWEETRRLEAIYQQKLTALAELKQSLLQKAFSGELTVRSAEAAVEEATA